MYITMWVIQNKYLFNKQKVGMEHECVIILI